MSGSDLVGLLPVLVWGGFVLWLFNKGILRSEYSLASLVAVWPFSHPKEFCIWIGMSIVVLGLLCLYLFTPNDESRLAQHHMISPGTFVEYQGDHGNFSYTFVVQGSRYHGYSATHEGNLDKIRDGLPFKVYYNPSNPNINSVADPVSDLNVGRTTVTFFSLLLIGILAIVTRKLGVLMRAEFTAPVQHTPS